MSIRIAIPLLTSLLLAACGQATDVFTQSTGNLFSNGSNRVQENNPSAFERILCHSNERPFFTVIGAQASSSDRGRTYFLKNFDSAKAAQILFWDNREFRFFFQTKANQYDAPNRLVRATISNQQEQPQTEEIAILPSSSEFAQKWNNQGWIMRDYGLVGNYLWIRDNNGTSIRHSQNPLTEEMRFSLPAYAAIQLNDNILFWVQKDNRWFWWNLNTRQEWNQGKPIKLLSQNGNLVWWEEVSEQNFRIVFLPVNSTKPIALPISTDTLDGEFIAPEKEVLGQILIRKKEGLFAWSFNLKGEAQPLPLPSAQLQVSGKNIRVFQKQFFFNFSQPSLPFGLYRWQPQQRNGQRVGLIDCEQPVFSRGNQ